MSDNRGWEDLRAGEKAAIIVAAIIQLSLLAAALADIYRRPDALVRGRKPLWVAVSFVNFVGPISYFLFGRKK